MCLYVNYPGEPSNMTCIYTDLILLNELLLNRTVILPEKSIISVNTPFFEVNEILITLQSTQKLFTALSCQDQGKSWRLLS